MKSPSPSTELSTAGHSILMALRATPSLDPASLQLVSEDGLLTLRFPARLFPFLSPDDIAVVTIGVVCTKVRPQEPSILLPGIPN